MGFMHIRFARKLEPSVELRKWIIVKFSASKSLRL
jgi:hypothetical protein